MKFPVKKMSGSYYKFLIFFLQNLIFTYINEKKNPSYTALLRPTRLLISEKSATYTIKWSYTIIWQVRVGTCKKLTFRTLVLRYVTIKSATSTQNQT